MQVNGVEFLDVGGPVWIQYSLSFYCMYRWTL